MSTKVGLLTEGPIDLALLPPLLSHLARRRAEYKWPVDANDVLEQFPLRKRGHGGVLDGVRRLVEALDANGRAAPFDHECFVILLDHRTRPVQEAVRKLIGRHDRFVLAVAIEEVEAWWLGDRKNTLAWSGLTPPLSKSLRYAAEKYHAESDDDPKRTLSELTEEATRFDRVYGEGDVDMAREFARDYWADFADVDAVRSQCAHGFGRFDDDAADVFRRIKAR